MGTGSAFQPNPDLRPSAISADDSGDGLSKGDTATEIGRLLASRSIVLTDVPPIPPTVRDPADDHLLALARASDVDHLVSGDKDLLPLGRHEGILILPPAVYARLLDAP